MNDFNWAPFSRDKSEKVLGEEAYSLIRTLYPICRSITGPGIRATLRHLEEYAGVQIHGVDTGTTVFDWTIPDEWHIEDGYIATLNGEKVVDFKNHNLHVVSYSEPVDRVVGIDELQQHLHSIPEKPDWIPYRTSYYNKTWGFCLSDKQRRSLSDKEYRVVIDSAFKPGQLNYGEVYIPGSSDDEFLIFTHICHPSLCNDNLSGISIAAQLINQLKSQDSLNRSYRFVFAPATIGSITWLHQNRNNLEKVKAGLVLAVAGDSGYLHYKESRQGNSYIDKLVRHILSASEREFTELPFSPYGYDERQFCSPGFNLPMGSLMRTPNGRYPEYHTSADNLDLVQAQYLGKTIGAYLDILDAFDKDGVFENLSPFGEPQLGKRGLYRKTGGLQDIETSILAKLWVLNQSDGSKSLLDIAEKSGLEIQLIQAAAGELHGASLLKRIA